MCHISCAALADSLDLVLRKDKALTRNHLFRQAKFCLTLRIIRPNIQDYPRFRILLRGFPSNKSLCRKNIKKTDMSKFVTRKRNLNGSAGSALGQDRLRHPALRQTEKSKNQSVAIGWTFPSAHFSVSEVETKQTLLSPIQSVYNSFTLFTIT
jgi:hypothetical protein